jgi:hypothetical protein
LERQYLIPEFQETWQMVDVTIEELLLLSKCIPLPQDQGL